MGLRIPLRPGGALLEKAHPFDLLSYRLSQPWGRTKLSIVYEPST